MWREIVHRIHDEEFPEIELIDMLVDNTAMQLVNNPRQFDVHRDREHVRRHPLRRRRSMLAGSARNARERQRSATARRSSSRATGRRPTSPARASPTRSPRSCPWA
jgi:hypothetical protein